jgi:hypothetical protein
LTSGRATGSFLGVRGSSQWLMVTAVLVALVGGVVLVNPIGNFPLNDDWSYGRAVKTLVEQHTYRLENWTSMPLFTQVLWGAAFAFPFGFSFTALRFSTLALALVAFVVLLLLARKLGVGRGRLAAFGALLVLFNPLFLALSCTFMTDVPFLAFLLSSCLFLVLGMEPGRPRALAIGIVLGVSATLIRQTGLILPLAFGLGWLTARRPSGREALVAVTFLVVAAAALVGYGLLLRSIGRLPTAYGVPIQHSLEALRGGLLVVVSRVGASGLLTFLYLGICLAPLAPLVLSTTSVKRSAIAAAVAAVLLSAVRVLRIHLPGNVLSDRGVGPFTLSRSPAFAPFTGSRAGTVAFGLLALAGGAALVLIVNHAWRARRESAPVRMLMTLMALCFVATALVPQLDRYVLVYLPFLVLLAMKVVDRQMRISRVAVAAAVSLLSLYAVFSVVAVRDYLAWNRVRWAMLDHLLADQFVPPSRIDGGFEFNGLYNYDESYVRPSEGGRWWVSDADYIVAFDSLPGSSVVERRRAGTWLPTGVKEVLLLRPSGSSSP